MSRRPGFFLPALALLAAGCAVPQPEAGARRENPAAKSAAVVFEKRSFKLLKTPDPELEAALEPMLTDSFDAAVKDHSGADPMEIGFTYSLAPKGAVYPFSEIEVSCIMQEKYARRRGPALCGFFFADLEKRVLKALAGRQ
ncbi:MAG: hypothetical protein ACYC2I_01995 [Elusimicrobiales bacterium]